MMALLAIRIFLLFDGTTKTQELPLRVVENLLAIIKCLLSVSKKVTAVWTIKPKTH